jgi:hypothetical protein
MVHQRLDEGRGAGETQPLDHDTSIMSTFTIQTTVAPLAPGPTSGSEIRESSHATRGAILLLVAFAIALSAPELTDIRRPFHDTVGLFYGRILFTDAMRNGSIPFWYPYTRYSIPMASLEGGMYWSPIGFLLGAVAPYGLFSWAVEGLIWNLICLSGAFMFARRHVTSPYTAAAIAMTYAANGLLVAAVPTIGTTRAFQIGPWVFQAIDSLVAANSWHRTSWARGTFTLAMAGTLWLSSGYPGIWLTAPVLVAPYALMVTRGRLWSLISLGTGAITAAVLALGMCAVLVDGTVNAPIYGEVGKRSPVSPGDGALQLWTLIHSFLANPGYHRDASGPLEPLYLGGALIPGLLLLTPRWHISIFSLGSFVGSRAAQHVAKLPAIAWAGVAAVVAFQGLIAGQPQPWIMLWIGFATLVYVSQRIRQLQYIDYAIIIVSLWSLTLSSLNIIGNLFRAHIPPFTFIRWNDWYAWIAMLCITVYAWRNLEAWVISLDISTTTKISGPNILLILTNIILVLSGAAIISFGVKLFPAPVPVDFDQIHTLTLYYILFFLLFGGIALFVWFLFLLPNCKRFVHIRYLWFLLLICVPVTSGLGIYATLPAEDQARRLATDVGTSFHHLWDTVQAIVIPIAAFASIRFVKHALSFDQKIAVLATFVAFDMSLAAPRIISHTEYLRAGQVGTPFPVDRVFSFTGSERAVNNSSMGNGTSLYNAVLKHPDQLRTNGMQPRMEAYDSQSSGPSPFEKFTRFPSRWSVPVADVDGASWIASVADLPGHQWGASVGDATTYPDCGANAPDIPSGLVTKLLPDRVDVSVTTDCTRLMVLMDTWAAGWSVSVDGRPAKPVRVNGVLRGVEVPTGNHAVTWFYRPMHWFAIQATIFLSFGLLCLISYYAFIY